MINYQAFKQAGYILYGATTPTEYVVITKDGRCLPIGVTGVPKQPGKYYELTMYLSSNRRAMPLPVYTPVLPEAALVRHMSYYDDRVVLFESYEDAVATNSTLALLHDLSIKTKITKMYQGKPVWYTGVSEGNKDKPSPNEGTPCFFLGMGDNHE